MKRQIEITFLDVSAGYDYTKTVDRDLEVILETIKTNMIGGGIVITEIMEV